MYFRMVSPLNATCSHFERLPFSSSQLISSFSLNGVGIGGNMPLRSNDGLVAVIDIALSTNAFELRVAGVFNLQG